MSLKQLADLRLTGKAPKSVWIIVGDCPRWIDESHQYIRIAPSDKPRHMDFRALVNLNVVIFEIGKYNSLFSQTIQAIEAAKPKELSLACRNGFAGASEEHEYLLKKVWQTLCPT
jgi:hypothetical protein